MGGRRVLRALVPFLGVLIAAGCTREGDTFFGGEQIVSAYPGGNASDHVPDGSADGLALSAPGVDVDEFRFFPNHGSPGDGLMLFTGRDTRFPFEGEPVHLFGSHFDGSTFTPPVEITGENQDDLARVDLDTATVGFLGGIPERDGDAIVLFRRPESGTTIDQNGNGIPENDGNERLYSCYFDASLRGRAEGEGLDGSTMIYGFSSLATFVDDDPGVDTEDADGDVGTFGFVSDGLAYSTEFGSEQESSAVSGQDTSLFYACWLQQGADGDEPRIHYNRFDLSSTTTRFDPAAAADLVDDAGFGPSVPSSVTLDDADVDPRLVVHNGLVLWQVRPDEGDDPDDGLLLANVFTATDVFPAERLSRTDADAEDFVLPFLPSPGEVYGSDHALPRYWLFFQEEGFDDGNTSPGMDLMVASLDLDGTAPQSAEIDQFGGADEPPVRFSSVSSAITRPGAHLFVTWIQDDRPSPEGPSDGATASLFARAVDPFVPGPIADAVTGDIGLDDTACRMNADVLDAPDEIRRDVLDAEPQAFLADGTSPPGLGLHSDPLRLHWVFVQEAFDDPQSTNTSSDLLELHVAYVAWDDMATAPALTADSGTASDTLVDSVDLAWRFLNPSLLSLPHVEAHDAGNGDVAVYYLNQGNHPDDASAVGQPGGNGQPTEVPALLLEIDISTSGGPSFQAGEILELGRLGNFSIVGVESGCSFEHIHAIGPFQGTRGIDIDGIGPYLEPVSRHPVCGYGPTTTLTIPPPAGNPDDAFAAFPESRLFAWYQGTGTEISSDGSSFGAPDYFQVDQFQVVPTPFNSDVLRNPGWGARYHNVLLRETNSGPGSPRILLHRRIEPLPDGMSVFSPALGQRPQRIDYGAPVDVREFVGYPDGDSVDAYLATGQHLYYNEWNGADWLQDGATIVDHDSPFPARDARPFPMLGADGEPSVVPTVVVWTKDLGQDGNARLNLRVRR